MDAIDKINKYRIILGSQSPRRQFLLHELGIRYEVIVSSDEDESFPVELKKEEIPLYLAKAKSERLKKNLLENTVLITADTIVWLEDRVVGKPSDFNEAVSMLKSLSGKKHTVYTGVCLKSLYKEKLFYAETDVYFRKLTNEEIIHYVKNYKPYDKAGAYGAQEWIGYIGIEHIEGSYFNVMGLPVQKLYHELVEFI